jgi:hypothetical protein
MTQPLMPKATAVWLVENTALTFMQIADFCGLHILEVQAIADEEVAVGMQGLDPVANGQITKEEIARCEADPSAKLALVKSDIPQPSARGKGPRYTPLSKRQDKPDAIAWLLRHYPELTDATIGRLIGTTKPTINAVRDRTHWNSPNLKPRSPVELGLCKHDDLRIALEKAHRAAQRKAAKEKKAGTAAPAAAEESVAEPAAEPAPDSFSPAEPENPFEASEPKNPFLTPSE